MALLNSNLSRYLPPEMPPTFVPVGCRLQRRDRGAVQTHCSSRQVCAQLTLPHPMYFCFYTQEENVLHNVHTNQGFFPS